MIGGSTSVGQPFDPILSYPKIISRCFNDSLEGKPIKIVNLAQGGMALEYSYWALQRELLFRPRTGCLLIYSGINENINNSSVPLPFFWTLARHSFLISKTLYLLGSSNSLNKYKYCLKQTIELPQSYNLKIVVSGLVGNFSGFDPDVTSDEEIILNGIYIRNLLELAYKEEEISNWNCALEKYINIDHSMPKRIPYINYKIGKCLSKMGMKTEADFYLTEAVDSGISTRPATWKNNAIRDIAASTHAYLIEPLPVFNKLSPNEVTDYHLFMDAHHPTIEGYMILANEFSKALSVIYHTPGIKGGCISDQFLKSFDILDKDEYRFFLRSSLWHICMTTSTYEPSERIISADNFLQKAKRLDPGNPEIVVYESVIFLLRKDLKNFRKVMNIHSVWSNKKMVDDSFGKLWAGKPREIPINTLNYWYSEGQINCGEFNKFISLLDISDLPKNCNC